MEVILVPDVKPEVDDLAGRTGRGDESSVTGQIESSDPKVTGAQSNNNTIKILNTKTLHPGQISTNSGSAGGTVYISSGGSLTTGSPVRTSTILTTPVGQQQLQAMAKSSGLNVVHVTLPQVEHFKSILFPVAFLSWRDNTLSLSFAIFLRFYFGFSWCRLESIEFHYI